MGIRPNQPTSPPRCWHTSDPVPVEVHDTLDGHPEIARWLCPDCLAETYGPPPKGPGSVSYRFGGITTREIARNFEQWRQ